MKRTWMLFVVGMAASAGCTTLSLEEYTRRQVVTSGEGRENLVLRALASVAADPDSLPSYALYSTGVAYITDSVTLNEASLWAPAKLSSTNLGMTASTSPKGQWTADPAGEYQQLMAVHAACLWALYGPERASQAYPVGILGDPAAYLDGKLHFGVEKRFANMRPGWVHWGCLKDVPLCARYKVHKGNTWVWVMPEDAESFAQFTLALQDIATLDPTLISAPPLLIQLTLTEVTNFVDLTSEKDKRKNQIISTTETRMVKPEYRAEIEKAIREGLFNTKDGNPARVNLTRAQWMAYTEPYGGVRNTVGTAPVTPTAASTSLPATTIKNVLTRIFHGTEAIII